MVTAASSRSRALWGISTMKICYKRFLQWILCVVLILIPSLLLITQESVVQLDINSGRTRVIHTWPHSLFLSPVTVENAYSSLLESRGITTGLPPEWAFLCQHHRASPYSHECSVWGGAHDYLVSIAEYINTEGIDTPDVVAFLHTTLFLLANRQIAELEDYCSYFWEETLVPTLP